MEMFLQRLFCFLAVFWLSACAMIGAANDSGELVRTLNEAIVAIPAEYYKGDAPSDLFSWGRMKKVKQELSNIVGEKKIPLVIYLHGCIGFDWYTNHDISFLLRNGYAVLAPNSHARKYRPASCNPKTHAGGLFRGILAYRLSEASYAHEAAKNLPWVDKRNIFMMGFSEGGITTAQYGRGGLSGRIILGWTCNSGWPEYRGISGPRDEPILAVVSSNDPWVTSPWVSGDCGRWMSVKRNAESVVVNLNTTASRAFMTSSTFRKYKRKFFSSLKLTDVPKAGSL